MLVAASYLVILLGFGLRALRDGRNVRLLWPWGLMGVFALCAFSGYLVPLFDMTETTAVVAHIVLAATAWTYGLVQLVDLAARDEAPNEESTQVVEARAVQPESCPDCSARSRLASIPARSLERA
jgi:hypothetical protein